MIRRQDGKLSAPIAAFREDRGESRGKSMSRQRWGITRATGHLDFYRYRLTRGQIECETDVGRAKTRGLRSELQAGLTPDSVYSSVGQPHAVAFDFGSSQFPTPCSLAPAQLENIGEVCPEEDIKFKPQRLLSIVL